MPWLADHKVNGQSVMSAAGFAEMALAAGCEALGLPVEAVQVNDLEVEQPLPWIARPASRHSLPRATTGFASRFTPVRRGGQLASPRGGRHRRDPRRRRLPACRRRWASGSETEIVLPDEAADHRRLLHPSGDARCGAAVSDCRDGEPNRRKSPPRPLTCRCHWRRSGCSARSGGAPGAARSWSSSEDDGGAASAGSSSSTTPRPGRRRSPASACGRWTPAWCSYRWRRRSSTPNGWRARRPSPAVHRPHPAGSWLLLADTTRGTRDNGTRGRIHHPVQLTDPAGDQRRAVRRVGSAGGIRESRGRFELPPVGIDRIRRTSRRSTAPTPMVRSSAHTI